MPKFVIAVRYLQKSWDWDAFPSNSGYPALERAQMRYIGTGGSPKVDPQTLPPGAFTCSLIYQEPGKRAATHYHHVEELFFVHRGTLTMTWQFGDETVDFTLGPGDAVLNPPDRPHGFSNEGDEDVVMQIMVATAAPMLPTYTEHPSFAEPATLRRATAARTQELLREIAPWIARASADGRNLVAGPHFRFALDSLARGATSPFYTLNAEEAFMVLEGVLDVEFGGDGATQVERFGPRDLAFVPAGVRHRLGNSDAGNVRFAAIVGDPTATPFGWQPALSTTAR